LDQAENVGSHFHEVAKAAEGGRDGSDQP